MHKYITSAYYQNYASIINRIFTTLYVFLTWDILLVILKIYFRFKFQCPINYVTLADVDFSSMGFCGIQITWKQIHMKYWSTQDINP